jgi:hypothetical protein
LYVFGKFVIHDKLAVMKWLLAITAVVEAGTGVSLAVAPSSVVLVLLGSSLDSPASLIIGRILGAALFSLGAVCWLARGEGRGRMVLGLIAVMLLYNGAAALLLGYARFGLAMSGVGLLPAIILHLALAAWCAGCLRKRHSL